MQAILRIPHNVQRAKILRPTTAWGALHGRNRSVCFRIRLSGKNSLFSFIASFSDGVKKDWGGILFRIDPFIFT
jgi:hypothetical protein